MKTVIVFAACLLLSACGSSSVPTTTEQPLDYFTKPVKVAMTVVDQTGDVQASDLTLTGITRTPETVALDLNMTVATAGTTVQHVEITISGRDHNSLQEFATIVTLSIQPGQPQVANFKRDYDARVLLQIESWTIDSIKSIVQPVIETKGIVLETLSSSGFARNLDTITFGQTAIFYNLSSSTHDFHWTVNGLTATDALVFSKTYYSSIAGHQGLVIGSFPGDSVLPTIEYDSITKWVVSELVRD